MIVARMARDYTMEVQRADELLERHPLLSRLRPEQVRRFAEAGQLESFRKGELIVTEGTPGDALYLILTGSVVVSKGERVLATLRPGEFFGEMSIVEPAARCATVSAVDTAFLYRLPAFALQNLLEDDPVALNSVLVTVVRVLSERLRRTNEMLSSVGELADWLAGSLV
jgi:CRP-like cAMP-binding protein